MSFQKKLSDVFNPSDASKNIYHSVEIRAAFVLEESTKGLPHGQKISKWLNLFTIMRFTPHHISNLSFEVPIDGPKVKFVTWNYPFENIWNRLIGGFASGSIQLDPITHQPYDPKYIYLPTKFDLLGQDFHSFPIHRENYDEEWPVMIKMFKTSSIDQASNIFRNDPEISQYIQSVTFENHEIALKEFLHLNIPPDQTDNLHMIFEIPYKISETKIKRKISEIVDLNVGIVTAVSDVQDLRVHIIQKISSTTILKASYSLTQANKHMAQGELLTWEIKAQIKNDPNSQIKINLFHEKLGEIEDYVKSFKELLISDDILQENITEMDSSTENRATDVKIEDKSLYFEEMLHPVIREHAYHFYKNNNLREAVLNSIIAVFDLIRDRTGLTIDGQGLVTEAFSLDKNKTKLIFSELETESGKNDQKGFVQILIGAYIGIRNPKAHTLQHNLDKKTAGQYMIFASLLARRVSEANKPQ